MNVGDLVSGPGSGVTFVRVCRSGSKEVSTATGETMLGHGDLVSVVGPLAGVDAVVSALGHRSTHDLTADRTFLDFRRITLSNPTYSGLTIADLNLGVRHGATVSGFGAAMSTWSAHRTSSCISATGCGWWRRRSRWMPSPRCWATRPAA